MGHCAPRDRAGTRLYLCYAQWVRAREINIEKYCRLQTVLKVMKLRGKRKAKPEEYKIYILAEDSSQSCFREEQHTSPIARYKHKCNCCSKACAC